MRLIAFAYLVHFLRHGMVFPLIPLFAERMGYSGAVIGAAVSAFSVLSFLGAVPAGRWNDRLGVRNMLLLSSCFNLIYSLLLFLAEGIWLLLPAQLLGGLGFLMLIVSSQSWVSQNQDIRIRERGFAFLSLAAAVGQSIGPFLGGYLLARTSFQAVFALAMLFSALGFVSAGLPRQERGRESESTSSRTPFRHALEWLAASPGMAAVLIFTFIAVFAASLRTSFIPLLFESQGLKEGYIGLLLSLFALSMTLVRVFVGRIMGVVPRKVLLALALSLILAGVMGLPAVSGLWLSGTLMLLFGAGFGISQPLSMVMVSDRAGASTSGLAMGIRFAVITLATLLSPVLTGAIVDGPGLAAAFYCVAGLILAAAFPVLCLSKSRT